MRDLIDLIRHVLGPGRISKDFAQSIARRAMQLEVELLSYLSHRYSLSAERVYERAAEFCGLAFSPTMPQGLSGTLELSRIDLLGSIRSVRATLYDREVLFLSPNAQEMLALRTRKQDTPGLFRDICVIPPRALREELVQRSANVLLEQSRHRLARRWPYASAHLDLTKLVRIVFVAVLALLVGAAALAPFWLEPLLVPLLTILFLPPAWFKLSALLDEPDTRRLPDNQLLDDDDLPVYSILIPLRDETAMVPQLAAAMQALDYPPEKLDIKFVVESVSTRTILAVRKILNDPRFELMEVPPSGPHTKPKALNYAMPMVRGEHVVVYDAEDIPEPDQLRRAATRFAIDADLDCIQAELIIDNADESWLTALFAAEYSGLFGVMLPALGRWRLPMPLGGTSNHFRVRSLREVGGWDAFNVTEDADLGVRLARLRYRVGTLASRTFEEAPVTLGPWMRQRTRWMKGWMQTFIVHNRYFRRFLKDAGWRNFLTFQIYVGGMILSAPLHTIFVFSLALRLLLSQDPGIEFSDPWTFAHLFVLVVGYIGAAALSIAGAARLERPWLFAYQPLLPLYWVLTGIAAFRAMYELLARPYFWAKTDHGVTRNKRRTMRMGRDASVKPDTKEKWSG